MDTVSDIKQRYGQQPKTALDEARMRGTEFADTARRRAQDVWSELTNTIRENPGTAIGIALVGGAVLGALAASALRSQTKSDVLSEASEATEDAVQSASSDACDTADSAKDTLAQSLERLRSFLDNAITKLR